MILLDSNTGAFALLAIFGAFAFVFFILAIVLYVLGSLGLYKLAQNTGIENPWLAWIPIANLYILAKLVKSVKLGSFEVPSLEIVLPVGCLAAAILGNIPVIGWLIYLAYVVLLVIVFYKLFTIYRPQQATLWIVLSIVLSFIGMPFIFLFIMRNDRPVA
ncbi:MAG: conserved rane protein of unknown function [Clostridiales bacterium]|nr:conserved rane protein of unknown function [Clostridiales bacterium]